MGDSISIIIVILCIAVYFLYRVEISYANIMNLRNIIYEHKLYIINNISITDRVKEKDIIDKYAQKMPLDLFDVTFLYPFTFKYDKYIEDFTRFKNGQLVRLGLISPSTLFIIED